MMSLEETARFLTEHPDWAPAILQIGGVFKFHGFNGPQGGYFTPDEIEHLLVRKPPSWHGWKKRRARP
jgi:hypothetical protein